MDHRHNNPSSINPDDEQLFSEEALVASTNPFCSTNTPPPLNIYKKRPLENSQLPEGKRPRMNNSSTEKKPVLRQRAMSEPMHPTTTLTKRHTTEFKPARKTSRKRNSSDRPPVNIQTLRELDLKEIFNNPRLRHDIYFDSALHFRPNLDGQRGEKKRLQADSYWSSVLRECEALRKNQRGTPLRKLIILFETMKDIVLSLVPTRDQKMVEQVFDQTLIIQQLEHGLLDFKGLAEWLAGLLKAHCAPMRDSWVDDMVSKVSDGVDKGKTALLVDGLKAVFGILEAMKLDVANHQIRTLRPFLVNSAADFEREHFYKRVDKGEVAIKEPQEWFQSVVEKYSKADFLGCLTHGVLDILTPSSPSSWKKLIATFTYDIERLETIKVDIREDTCMKVCLLLFRQLVLSSKCRRDIDDATISTLSSAIQALLGDDDASDRWLRNSSSIALQIAQSAAVFSNNEKKVLQDASIVKTSENWLAAHLQLDSKIYKMVESQIITSISDRTQAILKAWSVHKSPSVQTQSVMGFSSDFAAIPQRLAKILNLHWRIFDKIYLSSAQLKQLKKQQQHHNTIAQEEADPTAPTPLEKFKQVSDISFHVERKEFA